MSAIRAKLDAIKKEKISAIKKEKSASNSVQQLLVALSKPDKAPVRKPKAPAKAPAKDETAGLLKKLIGVLQSTQANNPKAKAKVQRNGILIATMRTRTAMRVTRNERVNHIEDV
eukprot:6675795-Prymnesium_polylepis.1